MIQFSQSRPPALLAENSRPSRRRAQANRDDGSLAALLPRRPRLGIAGLFALIAFLLAGPILHAEISMAEYQVKALFLCNFVKYVSWPGDATGPIVIAIVGQDNFNNSLTRAVQGKTFNGRGIVIKHLSANDDPAGCSILFVSSSEDSRLDDILRKAAALPILTVGENESFVQKGGIINFTLKEDKIHLQISLKAAQKVKLQISSKLLSVADTVEE